MSVLNIDNLSKTFRRGFMGRRNEVLRGVSLSLEKGEVYGFLGHNGAGKSTTIKLILGLLRPDGGRVTVFGQDEISTANRGRIGYLGEEIGLYPYLNAAEMLRLVGELFRMRGQKLSSRIDELLVAVGLAEDPRLRIKHFSKGMRQRLGIATALMNDPELLLLDEPYGGLDPVGRRQLRELLLALKDQGKTILLSSHIVPDVEAVCDRVGILSGGVIARSLDLNEVCSEESDEMEVIASGVDASSLGPSRLGAEHVVSGVVRDDHLTIVRCKGADQLEPLIAEIYRSGGKVVEIKPLKLDLEDIFVREISDHTQARTADEEKKADEMAFTR
jgi:ABC-2 type transport system ATP-binding protein